ncbi:hypothetical protein AQJ11_29445 [Streptomyces corchorusii]|uniref:Uncharacterized protein n=2 Tax=Streptomyces TaxID=1883 RepID=A0A101PZ27_STRCK|nr:hypothetical protein [Streptomyces corchorusii]KUN20325.1 hypothetical protein AQJ11_29445 [Streptomyces corchorusii]
MITAVGHADLTPATWELVRAELRERLRGLPPDATALVRAGAGLPLAFGRVVHEVGRRLVVLLPERGDAFADAPFHDRRAHRELLALAGRIRMLPFDPLDRDACVSADERLVSGCTRLLAVWDGSPSSGQDATAHMVAYARARGIAVEVVWPAGAARQPAGHTASPRVPEHRR